MRRRARAPRRRAGTRAPARPGWARRCSSDRVRPPSRQLHAALPRCRGRRARPGCRRRARAPAAMTATRSARTSRLLEVVGGEQDRGAARLQLLDELPELAPRLGVEAGGGLVEEQQLGAADDAERDVEPAALPAGQRRSRASARFSARPDGLDHLVDVARVGVVRRRSGAPTPRTVRSARSRALLQHDAEPRLRHSPVAVRRVGAEHADLAGVAVAGSPRGSRSSSSCRRRWGRAGRSTSPRSMRRSIPVSASTLPYDRVRPVTSMATSVRGTAVGVLAVGSVMDQACPATPTRCHRRAAGPGRRRRCGRRRPPRCRRAGGPARRSAGRSRCRGHGRSASPLVTRAG